MKSYENQSVVKPLNRAAAPDLTALWVSCCFEGLFGVFEAEDCKERVLMCFTSIVGVFIVPWCLFVAIFESGSSQATEETKRMTMECSEPELKALVLVLCFFPTLLSSRVGRRMAADSPAAPATKTVPN